MHHSELTRRQFMAAAGVLAVAGAANVRAQVRPPVDARKAFFDGTVIPALVIDIAPGDIEALRNEPRKYVKATLKEGPKTVLKDIGIHLKGSAGSFRPIDDPKPGFTLNMDKFVIDQKFRGFDKFHLNNCAQDPSYLSELISGELFRAANVPSARVGHATVVMNGQKRGLYVFKEAYDNTFLDLYFKSSNGNFYDGGFCQDIDAEKQKDGGKKDVKDQADLKALIAAASEADLVKRFKEMEKLLDMDRFVTYLAIEVILWDWDGYPMNTNNYRIYHQPSTNKLTFMPSGTDQMFDDINGPLFPEFKGMIAKAFIATPEGRKRYLARVANLVQNLNPDLLARRLDGHMARIGPVLQAVDPAAAKELPNHVNRIKTAIPQRAKVLTEQLKAQ